MVIAVTNCIPGVAVGPDPTIPLVPVNTSMTVTGIPTQYTNLTWCFPLHNIGTMGAASVGGACGMWMKTMSSTMLSVGFMPATRFTDLQLSDFGVSVQSPHSPTQFNLLVLR